MFDREEDMDVPPHVRGAAARGNGRRYHRAAWGGQERPTLAHV